MTGDQATATFVSANPAVREAIENAVPRLREVLADAGVTLGQTQVGSDSPQQSANGNENGDNSFKRPADGDVHRHRRLTHERIGARGPVADAAWLTSSPEWTRATHPGR